MKISGAGVLYSSALVGRAMLKCKSPSFTDDLRLPQRVEDLVIEELVIEALAVAVLPRLSRLGVGGFGSEQLDPVANFMRDERGTIARRKQALPTGHGHARSLDTAQRVAMT